MKAMSIPRFGGPEVFEEREVPEPEPGPGEVLVRVHAAAINPVDTKLREDGKWVGLEPPIVLGSDAAGVVEAVGPGVRSLEPGDEVYYSGKLSRRIGSYGEYNVEDAALIARKPRSLSFAEAASLPLAGMTAWDAVIERPAVRAGETVLIHGGGGGVGTLAIQLARIAGAHVFTTCGRYDFDLVEELGAARAIDYRDEDFVDVVNTDTRGEGVDVIVDTVGGDTLVRSMPALTRHGRMSTIIGITGDLSKAYRRNPTIHMVMMEREARKLDAIRRLVDRGQLRPVIDSVRKLADVGQAHRDLAAGRIRGKIVLSVDGNGISARAP